MMVVSLACASAMILFVGFGTMMWDTVEVISPAVCVRVCVCVCVCVRTCVHAWVSV